MTTILVTGGAGFVGSNFAILYKKKYPKNKVICLDNLKRRGSELNLKRLKDNDIEFVHGDVRCREDLNFKDKIDVIIECSAEPSVLAGLDGSPEYVINSNLIGAINCLELARKENSIFVFLSSSRIYPYEPLCNLKYKETDTRFEIDEETEGIGKKGVNESFPTDGLKSFYGAAKLCAEQFIHEYGAAYGVKYVINRFGVISGPWQMGKVDQGVFSLWVAKHFSKQSLKYIGFGGKGKQVRDLLHVEDLFDLIDIQLNNFEKCQGKTYNAGGGKDVSLSLFETTRLCEEITGNKILIESVAETRSVDIPVYITDNSKVTEELGWKPKRKPEKILRDIYDWIKTNKDDLKGVLL